MTCTGLASAASSVWQGFSRIVHRLKGIMSQWKIVSDADTALTSRSMGRSTGTTPTSWVRPVDRSRQTPGSRAQGLSRDKEFRPRQAGAVDVGQSWDNWTRFCKKATVFALRAVNEKTAVSGGFFSGISWSGKEDSNLRPLRPEREEHITVYKGSEVFIVLLAHFLVQKR